MLELKVLPSYEFIDLFAIFKQADSALKLV